MKCAMCGSELSSRFSGGFLVSGVSDKIWKQCIKYKVILKNPREMNPQDCVKAIEVFKECLNWSEMDNNFKVHLDKFYNEYSVETIKVIEKNQKFVENIEEKNNKKKDMQDLESKLLKHELDSIIITTTDKVEGKTVSDYIGVVHGETVLGTGVVAEFASSVSDLFGTPSGVFESKIKDARLVATARMIRDAKEIGADAIVALRYGYNVNGAIMMMVYCDGTAVKFHENWKSWIIKCSNSSRNMLICIKIGG